MQPGFDHALTDLTVSYMIRLRRRDGSLRNLPEAFAGPLPSAGAELPIQVDGEFVLARVEARSRWHSISPCNPKVQTVDVVTVAPVAVGPSR